jgi:hypothetical protein
MEVLDPKVALVTGVGAAVLSSHRVREVVGRGAGFAVAGASRIASPVVHAGKDIYGEARQVASNNKPAARSSAARK